MILLGSILMAFALGVAVGHMATLRSQRRDIIGEKGRKLVLPPDLSKRSKEG